MFFKSIKKYFLKIKLNKKQGPKQIEFKLNRNIQDN